jgi:Macrocin-O-methyltransferase (TylF)
VKKLQMSKFKRALVLNRDPLTFLPDIAFKLTLTPRFNFRARAIIRALNMLRHGVRKERNRLQQIAEFGVARGEGFRHLMILTAHYCALHRMPLPHFFAFDTFSGLPASSDPSDIGTWAAGDYPGDKPALHSLLNEIGFGDDAFTLTEGLFSETLPTMDASFGPDLVLIDCDYYTSTRDVFVALKDRLPTGAIIYFDDLGTNFYNPNLGEERLIHEINRGEFGKQYYLHPITDKLYYWSNAEKLNPYHARKTLDIPLKRTGALGNFH